MKKITTLFLAAFLLRLIALNQSLWLDEATTANVVRYFSYRGLVTRFAPTDFHPPLFYLLEKFWTSIFGLSEIALRFPSVIASLLTGLIVFLIAKTTKKINPLWAAAFFLFNPLVIYYSQEARMYSLLTLFITASFYFFLQKKYFLFNLFASLALLTHYGAVFFLLTLYGYLLIKRQPHRFFATLPGPLFALLLLFPLVLHQFVYSQTALVNVTHWSPVLGQANLKNLLLIPLKFTIGRISFYPKFLYYLLSGLAALITFFLALTAPSKFFKYFLITPLLLAFLVSFNTPMLQYFRYLFLLPLLALLLAQTRLTLLRLLVLVIFLITSLAYLFIPAFYREDWRSLAASLPRAATVYLIPSFADPLKYYRPDIIVKDVAALSSPPSSFILLPYGFDIYGLNPRPQLSGLGYAPPRLINFRQLTLETWSK
ncbi:glycosyltransferase family 39 protein [Patescibacteria group bacterium]|nr:glycosyltransferase family 39 protein [Patescibacteria group bacterium]